MIYDQRRRWCTPAALFLASWLAAGCGLLQQDGADAMPTDMDEEPPPQNTPPVANAGQDQTVTAGQLVVLDGAGSRDADGDQLLYSWFQVGGSPQVVLEDGFSARPRFFAPADVAARTVLEFRLTVVDGFASVSDDVRVTINPAP